MDCREFFIRWRNWIRPLVIAIYVLILLIALPLLVVELHLRGAKTHTQAWLVGGIFVILAIPISMWGILQHMIHYTQPHLQRHIIRVLWMVPIYAMDAWLALRFKEAAIYLDTLRECYEAYVVYNFMAYLLSFLTSQYPDLDAEIASRPQVKHIMPFCCLPSWQMGRPLIQYCKHGVLQYTVVRPLTTCLSLICQMCHVYHEGDFNFKSAWVYLALINNVSQVWAMYCLVLFYFATKDQLAPIQPVGKFMCIKAVVFLTFWQSVLIAFLVKVGVIRADNTGSLDFSTADIATGLQDFIICVEMFFAAIAHYFSFSHKPFMENDGRQADCCTSFAAMWDVSDVRADVVDHVRHVSKTVTRTLRRNPPSGNERTPLLQDGASGSGTYDNSLGNVVDFQSSQGSYLEAPRGSIGTINSLDASMADTVSRRSFTASMNNYISDFGESMDDRSINIHEGSETDDLVGATAGAHAPMSRSCPDEKAKEEVPRLKISHSDHGHSKKKESRSPATLITFADDSPKHDIKTDSEKGEAFTGTTTAEVAGTTTSEVAGTTAAEVAGTTAAEVAGTTTAETTTAEVLVPSTHAFHSPDRVEPCGVPNEDFGVVEPFKEGDRVYEDKEVKHDVC